MSDWIENLIESPGFCTRPFFHGYVTQLGHAVACCNNLEVKYGNINETSFNQVYSKENEVLINFRKQFLNSDKLPETCKRCFDPNNDHYRRTHIRETTRILKKYKSPEDLLYNDNLYTYDVRFSNLCNIMCVYCGPSSSSRFAYHKKEFDRNRISMTVTESNRKQFLDRFETSIQDVVSFYFAGGEPMIMPEHYDILELCLKYNKRHIKLEYNSNLTKLGLKDKSVIDYWKKFNYVCVGASIDAGWRPFEFIRVGAKWNKVVNNLAEIRKLTHVSITLTPTFAFWNMEHFPEVYKYLVENNLIDRQYGHFGSDILDHEHFRPGVLPEEYKNYIRELYATEYKDYPELLPILRHLDEDLTHLLDEAKIEAEELAKKNRIDLYDSFPNMKEIFKNVE